MQQAIIWAISEPDPCRYMASRGHIELINPWISRSNDDLKHFFRILYKSSEEQVTDKMERLISSAADDAVYATTRGQIKHGKHLTLLGVSLKSMTGSRK